MSTYRLLALDLDGTTLLDNKKISETNIYWIRKAVEKGVTVSFATGRGRQTANCYRAELGLTTPMVFLNGAEVWKTPEELFERHFLSKNDILQLHQLAIETNSWFWGFTTDHFIRKPDWTEDLLKEEWLKFGLLNDDLSTIEHLKSVIDEWANLEITQSSSNNLEISKKGITKEHGIRKVCSLLDIEMNQVMAIGDSFNDEKLLRSVGLGVAMGNAPTEIKEIADVITSSNEEDGVAKAICQYIFETDLS
ncbi:Cof-type HAD-IIB family hydrolase [Fredinandcohnia humi]